MHPGAAGEYRDSMTEPGAPGAPGGAGEPRRRRQSPVVAAALVLIAAAVLSTATLLAARWVFRPHAQPAPGKSSGVGFVRLDRQARPVSLPSLHGSAMVDLSGLAGKPIVMNFWRSTCDPCKRESPALAGVARTLGGKVSFVGIDTIDNRAKATAFVTRYKVSYPIAFDPNGTVADEYGVPGLPVTVFLSPSGKTVVGENVGALTATKLRRILHQLYGLS
jgi:cytochrome c biogenesis protein CcmG, thiol:disulfide interchange protein DsbE